MNSLLCSNCKKKGFINPSACCPGNSSFQVGDHIEFLSDEQTEKGPSTGVVEIVDSNRIVINHSDITEEFFINDLSINRKSKHYNGKTLWILN